MAPFNPTHDYYAVLESSSTATYEEIKSSYHRLARIHHPDKNPGCANSTATTQLINEAWETLRDSKKRNEYDFFRCNLKPTATSQQSWPRPRTQPNQSRPNTQPSAPTDRERREQAERQREQREQEEREREQAERQSKRRERLSWEKGQRQIIDEWRICVENMNTQISVLEAKNQEIEEALIRGTVSQDLFRDFLPVLSEAEVDQLVSEIEFNDEGIRITKKKKSCADEILALLKAELQSKETGKKTPKKAGTKAKSAYQKEFEEKETTRAMQSWKRKYQEQVEVDDIRIREREENLEGRGRREGF